MDEIVVGFAVDDHLRHASSISAFQIGFSFCSRVDILNSELLQYAGRESAGR